MSETRKLFGPKKLSQSMAMRAWVLYWSTNKRDVADIRVQICAMISRLMNVNENHEHNHINGTTDSLTRQKENVMCECEKNVKKGQESFFLW